MYKTLLRNSFKYSILFTFLSLVPVNSFSQTTQNSDTLSREDIVRGERLFFGLVYLQNKSMNCAHCHITTVDYASDTMNWNPNALEISLKYLQKTPADLGNVLLKPSGAKMAASHKGFKLSAQEIVLIKGYMDSFPEKGLKKDKPVITNLLLFIIASALFLFSVTDLIFTKKLKKKWIHYLILTITTGFITYILVKDAIAVNRAQGYSPDQPVKFSHKVHAGQNRTDCIYCHSYAPYSKMSGIPPENVCMNCHLIVRNGRRSGMFEISKVTTSFENKVPIQWIRVHNLPDHVFFSHSQHVSAGKIDCTVCHGQVKEMDRIKQVSDLSMGWCVNCHRTTKVYFKENQFYSQYKVLSEKIRNGELDSVDVSHQGGTDCMRCHY